MRALVLLMIVAFAAGCGDGTSFLVSADAGTRVADGCVAPAPRGRESTKWLVRDGDSLRRIARKVYGDEKLWKAIAAANPDKIGKNGTLAVGVELSIPFDGI